MLVMLCLTGSPLATRADPIPAGPTPGEPASPEASPAEPPPLEASPLDPWMPLTLEEEAARRDLLWRRVILLEARPRTADLEEPGLAPLQVGQAARVDKGRLCTAMLLLEGATGARLTGPDGREATGTVQARDAESLLAWLPCDGPCRAWPEIPGAPASARAVGQGLFVVLPSLPGQPVLSPTVSLGAEASPFPALFAVAGRLAPGTLLFDRTGALAGVVVRAHPQRADRCLAAPAEACAAPASPGGPAVTKGPPPPAGAAP